MRNTSWLRRRIGTSKAEASSLAAGATRSASGLAVWASTGTTLNQRPARASAWRSEQGGEWRPGRGNSRNTWHLRCGCMGFRGLGGTCIQGFSHPSCPLDAITPHCVSGVEGFFAVCTGAPRTIGVRSALSGEWTRFPASLPCDQRRGVHQIPACPGSCQAESSWTSCVLSGPALGRRAPDSMGTRDCPPLPDIANTGLDNRPVQQSVSTWTPEQPNAAAAGAGRSQTFSGRSGGPWAGRRSSDTACGRGLSPERRCRAPSVPAASPSRSGDARTRRPPLPTKPCISAGHRRGRRPDSPCGRAWPAPWS